MYRKALRLHRTRGKTWTRVGPTTGKLLAFTGARIDLDHILGLARGALVAPEPRKSIWCQRSVSRGAFEISVAEVMRQAPGIVSIVGEFVANVFRTTCDLARPKLDREGIKRPKLSLVAVAGLVHFRLDVRKHVIWRAFWRKAARIRQARNLCGDVS